MSHLTKNIAFVFLLAAAVPLFAQVNKPLVGVAHIYDMRGAENGIVFPGLPGDVAKAQPVEMPEFFEARSAWAAIKPMVKNYNKRGKQLAKQGDRILWPGRVFTRQQMFVFRTELAGFGGMMRNGGNTPLSDADYAIFGSALAKLSAAFNATDPAVRERDKLTVAAVNLGYVASN